jgi:hypothetical protein
MDAKAMIEAFTIFAKYGDEKYILGAEHDVIFVYLDPKLVSKDDKKRLKELGFEQKYDGLENFYCYV